MFVQNASYLVLIKNKNYVFLAKRSDSLFLNLELVSFVQIFEHNNIAKSVYIIISIDKNGDANTVIMQLELNNV